MYLEFVLEIWGNSTNINLMLIDVRGEVFLCQDTAQLRYVKDVKITAPYILDEWFSEFYCS
jgi:hypothetical protein